MSGLDERLERSVQLSVTHITWQTDAITFLFGFFFFFFPLRNGTIDIYRFDAFPFIAENDRIC